MNDFTYSAIRSFNQYLNTNLSVGTDEQLILTPSRFTDLDKDTVRVEFYDQTYSDSLGRFVGTSQGRNSKLYIQIDCLSPPNAEGEERSGANRKLKDRVEEVFKDTIRIPILSYGTAGTQVERNGFIRQDGAMPIPDEGNMPGWTRWKLNYRMEVVDTE